MVAGAYYVAVTYAEPFPFIHGGHKDWRYTLLSGRIPAIPAYARSTLLARIADLAGEKIPGDLEAPQHLSFSGLLYEGPSW